MEGIERELDKVVTAGELLEKVNAENAALRAIVFGLYNGGIVPAEHVALYQEIGESAAPVVERPVVGFKTEAAAADVCTGGCQFDGGAEK